MTKPNISLVKCRVAEAQYVYCPQCDQVFDALNKPWSLRSVMWMHRSGQPDHKPIYVKINGGIMTKPNTQPDDGIEV